MQVSGGVREVGAAVVASVADDVPAAASGVDFLSSSARTLADHLPSFEGVEELHRIVQRPHAALTDADRGAMLAILGPVRAAPVGSWPDMPYGTDVDALARAITPGATPEIDAACAVEHQHLFDVWNATLRIDPADEPAIASRIEAILSHAATDIVERDGMLGELRALLWFDRSGRFQAKALGVDSGRIAAIRLHGFTLGGEFSSESRQLLHDLATYAHPERRAEWDRAVEAALRDGTPLPETSSLNLVMSDATGWSHRSSDERLRLLDALAGPADAPRTAMSAYADDGRWFARDASDVQRHAALQFDRALAGAPMPRGASIFDLTRSAGWAERPGADRERLLERLGELWGGDGVDGPVAAMSSLESSRATVERLALDGIPGVGALRSETLDMVERNLARIEGRGDDVGYHGHPDYAEVGKAAANATLLRSIADATPASERLAW